jgi:heptaprenyl diphosphate synthase
MRLTTTREDHRIAWLAALAVAIHLVEAALPSPLPGIKPGLANVIVIVVLVRFGWGTAAWVSLLRVLVSGLLLGTFLSPTFALSLGGALCSVVVLWLATRGLRGALGAIGYSVLAALAHMAGQFAIAYTLFIPHPGLLHLLPVLLTLALLFGVISGILARIMLNALPETAR